jgi:hypothetical protein
MTAEQLYEIIEGDLLDLSALIGHEATLEYVQSLARRMEADIEAAAETAE